MSTKWFIVVTLLSVALFWLAQTVGNWSLFLFDVNLDSALLAVTNIICNALLICPVSSFAVSIVTVYLLFLKNFALSFSMTVLSSIVSFIPFEMLFFACFISKTKYTYKANFSVATHICRLFYREKTTPPDLEAIIAKNLIPIRPDRHRERNVKAKIFQGLMLEYK